MRTPFPARRDRRCSSPRCAHGGRIRRGQEVVRYGHREFMHTDDVAPLFAWFAQMADAAARAMPAVVDWFTHVAQMFSEFAQRVAIPLLREQAEADAAHLVDLLWAWTIGIRPDVDRPGSILIVADDLTQGPTFVPALRRFLDGLHVGYVVEEVADDGSRLTLRLTRDYRVARGLGLWAPAEPDDEDVYA